MNPRKLSPPVRPIVLPAYGIAYVAAAVSMVKGGVQASLLVFGVSFLAAVAVEVIKLRTG